MRPKTSDNDFSREKNLNQSCIHTYLEQRVSFIYIDLHGSILTVLLLNDGPVELLDQHLHAVANTQNRDLGPHNLQ